MLHVPYQSFNELADEFAQYLDNLRKTENDEGVKQEIQPLLEKDDKIEVLKKLVTSSSIINQAPEKGLCCFSFISLERAWV